ncbi:cupin domain-containing protein [Falsigemmobacter faecalis]|uniref:Cupin domain-containing protein n=1 Tax=Falsigemmobacter faecalis TaxID=2488730 RepID=A0A3P3DPM1_9RHOB|nr:cupin domain-containing protein [Falsigemmobacter faecalis]RRH76217.1 cupin domain-containing protein [Falsigemmobacter faecalis]
MNENIGEASQDGMLQGLGERIRGLRQQRQLTLQELSGLCQVSVAMLSHIERGRATPSIRVLDRIRLALDVQFGAFFDEDPPLSRETEARIVTRAEERPVLRFEETGLVKELLSPARGSQLEMMVLRLDRGGHSGDEPWRRVGEKCGLVLEGSFELTLNGQSYALRRGDAFQFDSALAHSFRNTADGESQILWIILSRESG